MKLKTLINQLRQLAHEYPQHEESDVYLDKGNGGQYRTPDIVIEDGAVILREDANDE